MFPSHLRGPLALLGVVSIGTATTVWYVHFSQAEERRRMYEGVKRDIERQQRRKQRIESEETRMNEKGGTA